MDHPDIWGMVLGREGSSSPLPHPISPPSITGHTSHPPLKPIIYRAIEIS